MKTGILPQAPGKKIACLIFEIGYANFQLACLIFEIGCAFSFGSYQLIAATALDGILMTKRIKRTFEEVFIEAIAINLSAYMIRKLYSPEIANKVIKSLT